SERDSIRAEKEQNEQSAQENIATRDSKIAALQGELQATTEKAEQQEGELNGQLQQKLERIGELEGEVEAVQGQLKDASDNIAALNEQIVSLETEGSVKDSTVLELTTKLQELQESSEKAQQELIAKLRAGDDALAKEQATLADTQVQLQTTTDERDSLRQRLN